MAGGSGTLTKTANKQTNKIKTPKQKTARLKRVQQNGPAKGNTCATSKEKLAKADTFQWIETFTGELTLLSLTNHRYLRLDATTGQLIADSPGPLPNAQDGVRFNWTLAN